jgi:hypothetical protein
MERVDSMNGSLSTRFGSMLSQYGNQRSLRLITYLVASRVSISVTIGLALAVAGVATQSAYGQDRQWVGDTSSDWNTATNWSDDIFPAAPGDAIINNTAGPGVFPVITADGAFTPRDIRVGTAGVGTTGRIDHRSGTIGTGDGNWFFLGYG